MGTTKAHGKIPCIKIPMGLSSPAAQGWRASPELISTALAPTPAGSLRALWPCRGCAWEGGLGGEAELLVQRQLGAAAGLVPALWVRAELWSSPGSPSLEAGCLK